MAFYYLMPVVFIVGVIAIAMEDKIRVNKAATALTMCIIMWTMLSLGSNEIFSMDKHDGFAHFINIHPKIAQMDSSEQVHAYLVDHEFLRHLGEVSETLFFVMSSMLIVSLIDKYGGFKPIILKIRTNSKRKLLWRLAFMAFFLSALLDNLAAAIVLIALLRKLVPDQTDRLKYACMIIIAANAGGAWTPIGDVTTLLLWTRGNITPLHQMSHLIVPALVNLLIPTTIGTFLLFKKGALLRQASRSLIDEYDELISQRERWLLFIVGILSLALVPVFQVVTGLPPFLLVLFGLTLMWIYTDLAHAHKINRQKYDKDLSIYRTFQHLDLSTIFFFLGILMSVGALVTGGQLIHLAHFTDTSLHSPRLLAALIGVGSSFLDNVALVAATMGMYPIDAMAANVVDSAYAANFIADGDFWTFLAYSAVTGGSLLIMGSATGVSVMGMENISFMYYFKRFSLLALSGFVGGALVYLLLFS